MFTGIIQTTGNVIQFESRQDAWRLGIECEATYLNDLQIGASVAIDGTCLTVVACDDTQVFFDVIGETLSCTCLGDLQTGNQVNVERSARFGDEIGGHILSGHIHTTAIITDISQAEQQFAITLRVAPQWIKYIIPKGFIALSGASLTVVDVDAEKNIFSVHLIPETRRLTTFGQKQPGMKLNIEIDQQTKTIVDTIMVICADMPDRFHTMSASDQKS